MDLRGRRHRRARRRVRPGLSRCPAGWDAPAPTRRGLPCRRGTPGGARGRLRRSRPDPRSRWDDTYEYRIRVSLVRFRHDGTRAMTPRVIITGDPLSPDDVIAVADRTAIVEVGPSVAERMAPARRLVEQAVESGDVVYGVTTGFGALATTRVKPEMSAAMQASLLRSHAAGVGEPLPDRMVRAMLVLRARTLAHGHS